ncbi:MAG: hypothetical protein ACFFF4_03130, partial [Candidatus Thorarchaeota archaeon]
FIRLYADILCSILCCELFALFVVQPEKGHIPADGSAITKEMVQLGLVPSHASAQIICLKV